MPKQQPLLIASRFPQLLSIAVLILFVHAIFQQSIISSMREELRVALGGDKSATSSSVKEVDFHTYLNSKSPPALPSIVLNDGLDKEANDKREIYGGKKDAVHLGGFTEIDPMGISENLWNFMLGPLAIKSIVDVGCGRGHSTSYFHQQGAKVLCVEGSHDAVTQSLLPADKIVEHDFSRGPWWPEETYDAAWSVEFLEHVGRPYMKNYLPVFKKAAVLFVTSSAWGGWHHVEVHEEWWWRARLSAQGFVYSQELTDLVRLQAQNGITEHAFGLKDKLTAKQERDEHRHDAQHIWTRMLVFINPIVAALPRHHHLFGGNGCFSNVVDNRDGGAPCGTADSKKGIEEKDSLPNEYQSILNCYRSTKGMADKGNWKQAIWECTRNPQFARSAENQDTTPLNS